MAITPLKYNVGDLKAGIIANSATIAVGMEVVSGASSSSEFISAATNTSALLLGNVVGIQGKAGEVLEVDSKAVASDNQTVAQIQAVYLPSYIPTEFTCTIDAAAGTTTGSDGVGFFTIVSGNAAVLDESTWVAISGTASHFASFGVNPRVSTEVFAHTYLSF